MSVILGQESRERTTEEEFILLTHFTVKRLWSSQLIDGNRHNYLGINCLLCARPEVFCFLLVLCLYFYLY